MTRHCLTLLALGVLSSVLLFPPGAGAQDDFYALYNRYQFHHIGVSARSAGMGGVYSALTGGEMGLVGNPASLGFQENRFVMFNADIEEIVSDVSSEDPFVPGAIIPEEADADIWSLGGGIAYPFEWGGLGLYYHYRDDDIHYDSQRFSLGTLDQSGDLSRHGISVGGGYRVRNDIAVGYRYSYLDWDADTVGHLDGVVPMRFSDDVDFEGHRNHFGVQYRANEMFMFGLDGEYGFGDRDSTSVITTGGSTVNFSSSDPDTWSVRGGVAWESMDLPLLLAMDIKFENRDLSGGGVDTNEDLWGIHLGAEYELMENLYLRGGYQYEDFDFEDRPNNIFEAPSIGSYTAGVGYEYQQFSIDYGFIWSDTGGSGDFTHVVGVGFHF